MDSLRSRNELVSNLLTMIKNLGESQIYARIWFIFEPCIA